MTLSAVDFPAPFGPIRPVIRPGGISKDAPLTAWTPPNWRCRFPTVSRGPVGPAGRLIGPREAPPPLGDYPPWPEPQEDQCEHSHDDPLQGVDEPWGAELGDEAGGLKEGDRHQQRPDHDAQ